MKYRTFSLGRFMSFQLILCLACCVARCICGDFGASFSVHSSSNYELLSLVRGGSLSWPPLDDNLASVSSESKRRERFSKDEERTTNYKYNRINNFGTNRNAGVASKRPPFVSNAAEPDFFRDAEATHLRSKIDSNQPNPYDDDFDYVSEKDNDIAGDNENDPTSNAFESPFPEFNEDDGVKFRNFFTINSNSSNPSRSWNGENDRFEQMDVPWMHSPVRYKYYGRRRANRASIPFILIGPDVDHWKTTSQELAARGFSVIVCEVADDEENDGEKSDANSNNSGDEKEGCNLVLGLLEALRWKKAVIVGCDSEAVLAIQAALHLAPDRVAGVVLCGDLDEVNDLVIESYPLMIPRVGHGNFAVDNFLKEYLRCPFAVVWDGEAPPAPTPTMTPAHHSDFSPNSASNSPLPLGLNRSLIIGGGAAPHRRRPEQLAWVLTRFVEDKIASSSMILPTMSKLSRQSDSNSNVRDLTKPAAVSSAVGEFFSSGSLVVVGRVVASMLIYGTMIRVGIYQYENFRGGIIRVKSGYDVIWTLRGKVVGVVSSFVANYGYVFKFLKGKSAGEAEAFSRQIESKIENKIESNIESKTDSGTDPETEMDSETLIEKEESETEESETEEQEKTQGDEESNEKEELTPPKTPEKQRNDGFRPTFLLDHVIA